MLDRIEWLGHASFRIHGAPIIYIDPFRVTRPAPMADVILISHDHTDHCSPADVAKIRNEATVILGNAAVATHVEGVTILRSWQAFRSGRTLIKSVPAYNGLHVRELDHFGFVIAQDHYDLYYAGDTGVIPEMANLRPDIAILPISGKHTMTVQDAVEAVKLLRPRWVIPSHWGNLLDGGTIADVRVFTEAVGSLAEVVVPERVS